MNKIFSCLKNSLLFCLLAINCLPLYAQQNNIIPPPPYIKTVVLKPLNPEIYAPVVKLGEILTLSFDDINAEQKIYIFGNYLHQMMIEVVCI